jgi:uncharacterized protein (TIGR03437 family)
VPSPNNPAARGSVVTLFVNSAQPWQPYLGEGSVVNEAHPQFQGSVTVVIGGTSAGPRYAGNSPGSVAALWQINAVVPNGISASATTSVRIVSTNNLLQRVTIAVR